MSKSHCTTTIQVAHTDIACNAASALSSSYLTGGPQAKVLTMKKHAKCHNFALGPHCHSMQGGSADFGRQMSWKIGRQGDYLVNSWLRVEIDEVKSNLALNSGEFLRWTHNLGHNLIENLELGFSGVPGATFDDFFLDFFSAFSVPAGKRNAYDNMIGNIPELVNPVYDTTATAAQLLPKAVLNIPLPLPYVRDVGVALPTGALVYNEVILQVCFRDWDELLVVSNGKNSTVNGNTANSSRAATSSDVNGVPKINSAQLWGNYVVVTSDERKRMGKTPRDCVWQIVQTSSDTAVTSGTVSSYLRYSHAVSAIFFAVRNTTVSSERSNYTTRGALTYTKSNLSVTEFPAPNAFDPIDNVSLKYEGADRLHEMPVDYFSLIQPYYHGVTIPSITGYHVFSYSHNFVMNESLGSVDYGKLTNVSLEINLSEDAIKALAGQSYTPFTNEAGALSNFPPGYKTMITTTAGVDKIDANAFSNVPQKFEFKNCCLAHTVVRTVGGGLGFPIF